MRDGRAREHRFTSYWRDVGTVEAYWSSHMELVSDSPPIDLDPLAWPVLSKPTWRSASRVHRGAEIVDGLLGPGGHVFGRLERSVISPGVLVGPGAVVTDFVLLHDVTIPSDTVVERTVVDDRAVVGKGARVGASDSAVTMAGSAAEVTDGEELEVGARYRGPTPD